jgi:hypothetical protein
MTDAAAAPRPLPMRETIALFGVLFATIAFSIDAMLPALTVIGAALSPEERQSRPACRHELRPRHGLRHLLRRAAVGRVRAQAGDPGRVSRFIAAALVGAFERDLTPLLVAAFRPGALAPRRPRVVTLAMVRDMYAGRDMARVMSFIMMVFILIPAVAPSIGAGQRSRAMAKAPLILSLSLAPVAAHDDLVVLDLGQPVLRLDELHQPGRVGELVVVELDRRALRAAVELGDAGALAHRLDAHDQQQRVDLARQLAEAVDQLGGEAFQLHLGVQPERRR